jgi:RNA polymerase sigma-70 factor, ECF subfamily
VTNSGELGLLLARARTGDGQAADQLLTAYRNYLKLLARVQVDRVLQAKIDPSDLVQEVCLQVHRDLPKFRGQSEGEFLAWLRTILASKGANVERHFRGTQRRDIRLERQLVEAGEKSSVLLAGPTLMIDSAPSKHAMRKERSVMIANALAQLPAHYREVVILLNLEELPLAEVAQRLDKSVDSVRKLWARAVIQLRQLLENEP